MTTFSRRPRAEHRARRLGRRRRLRRRGRRAARRRLHRRAQLGVDLLHQHARSALVAIALAPVAARREPGRPGAKSFDALGAVLVTGGPLDSRSSRSRRRTTTAGAPARRSASSSAAVALLAGFVVREQRASDPLMSFSIFRIKTVSGANVAGFILGTALFSMFLMLTLYMQQVLGYSAMKTGVAYLAVAGTSILWAAVALAARDEDRRQAGARRRDEPAHGRPPLLHAGLGRRLVPRRPAARAS